MKAFDFNQALLNELEVKTLRAERTHLYKQLLQIDSRDGMKYVGLSSRIQTVNKKLFKLTGNPIYR